MMDSFVRQVWPISGGEITLEIRTTQPIPADRWVALAHIFEAVISQLAMLNGPMDCEEMKVPEGEPL